MAGVSACGKLWMKSLQKMKLSPTHRNWTLGNHWATNRQPIGDQSATSLSVNRLEAEEWDVVWMASDGSRDFAVKFLPPRARFDSDCVEAVRRRFRIASGFRHEHICNPYRLIEDPVYGPSLVMDYVLGQKLNDLFWKAPRKGQPFSSDLALQILKPIASTLHYVHQAGVLHGDVRPQNILVVSSTDPIWDVHLIDFGIACRFGENADESDEMVHDNPLYKAPEQLRDVQ